MLLLFRQAHITLEHYLVFACSPRGTIFVVSNARDSQIKHDIMNMKTHFNEMKI